MKTDQTLHIDIPVKLEKANVVFNIDHLAKMGDLPYPIAHLDILNNDFKDWSVKGQIIAIFHSDAGYVMLDDNAYNIARNVKTGNPYKALLVNLMNQGVKIELCGATAKANKWINAYLIPGVKVNTNAMVRLIQLSQEGYVQL
ncbi:MAG: sulfur reduction protein DsrE [Parachlamydia sp.]|nr:MAG: sulfur reduction protein DsrE [Parachlamydia sp.]